MPSNWDCQYYVAGNTLHLQWLFTLCVHLHLHTCMCKCMYITVIVLASFPGQRLFQLYMYNYSHKAWYLKSRAQGKSKKIVEGKYRAWASTVAIQGR